MDVTINIEGLRNFQRQLHNQMQDPTAPGPIRDCLNEQWPTTILEFERERFDRLSRGGGEWPPLARATIANRRGPHQKQLKQLKLRLANLTPGDQKKARKLLQVKTAAMLDHLAQLHGRANNPAEKARRLNQAKAWARLKVFKQFRDAGAKIGTRAEILGSANVSILRDTGTLFRSLTRGNPGNTVNPIPNGVQVGIGGSALHDNDATLTTAKIARFHQDGGPRLPQRRIVVEPDQATIDRLMKQLQRALEKTARGETT